MSPTHTTGSFADPDWADILPALRRLGLVDDAEVRIEPLTGGVSSDIVKVMAGNRAVEAEGRRRLARAGRAQPLRGGLDGGGGRHRS
jgi:hypothetical protein